MQDDNTMVGVIRITAGDTTPNNPAVGQGMFNPLGMLANQSESIMGGISGRAKPEEKKSGQPIVVITALGCGIVVL